MKIEHFTNTSGDWEVILVNGEEYYSGHQADALVWVELVRVALKDCDTISSVKSKRISDRKMEEMGY